jgi:hypothetical protein
VRPAVARARAAVRPDRALHDLRQGDMRRVLDWILADKDRVAVQEASARAGSQR